MDQFTDGDIENLGRCLFRLEDRLKLLVTEHDKTQKLIASQIPRRRNYSAATIAMYKTVVRVAFHDTCPCLSKPMDPLDREVDHFFGPGVCSIGSGWIITGEANRLLRDPAFRDDARDKFRYFHVRLREIFKFQTDPQLPLPLGPIEQRPP